MLRPLHIGFACIVAGVTLFVLWAALAPLSTSIPTQGHLNASRPSFDVQHPYGGKIAEIHIREHATVTEGALLITLDVTQEQAERAALQRALTQMMEERAAIRAAVAGQLFDMQGIDALRDPAQMAIRRMQNMEKAMRLRARMSSAQKQALEERAAFLARSISQREAQQRSMMARKARYEGLRAQGAFRAADIDALSEDILELDSALERDRAERASLRNQALQAEMQATREQVEHRQKLLDRLAQLEEAIPRLQRQVLGLSARIDQADIRAPEAGIVASLFYDTAAMVVARGDTVLTLSRPTERHQVSFIANPQVIDQLHVGMPGQLTVAALPQRSHPRVSATITSLSPEARRNSDGAVVGYDGVAEIDAEDHAALLAQLGDDATLTTDMPVSVVFAGRQTTFGAYLVGPFWGFLEKAMQD